MKATLLINLNPLHQAAVGVRRARAVVFCVHESVHGTFAK
jgi:hypothetical protein